MKTLVLIIENDQSEVDQMSEISETLSTKLVTLSLDLRWKRGYFRKYGRLGGKGGI